MLVKSEQDGLRGGTKLTIYSFQEEVNKPEHQEGNTLCLNYLLSCGKQAVDVSKDSNYFKRGIDIIVKNPEGEVSVDVKTDTKMNQTGNLAIEMVEICSVERKKSGWVFSKIDFIYYLNFASKDLYTIPLEELRKISFSQPFRGFSAYHKYPIKYFTLGILVPSKLFNKYKINLKGI